MSGRQRVDTPGTVPDLLLRIKLSLASWMMDNIDAALLMFWPPALRSIVYKKGLWDSSLGTALLLVIFLFYYSRLLSSLFAASQLWHRKYHSWGVSLVPYTISGIISRFSKCRMCCVFTQWVTNRMCMCKLLVSGCFLIPRPLPSFCHVLYKNGGRAITCAMMYCVWNMCDLDNQIMPTPTIFQSLTVLEAESPCWL